MARPDRGAALAVVLWGLVVGGALLTLVTILAVQEQRAAAALRREEHGLVGAERVGAELIATMTAGKLGAEVPRSFDSLSLVAGSDWNAVIRRLTSDVVLLEVAPRLPTGAASREAAGVRLGWLLRPRPDSISLVAAVSVGGPVSLGDGVVISGVDSCSSPGSGIAGIVAPSVAVSGSARLEGSPPVLLQGGADFGVFDRFNDRATFVLPAGTYSTGPVTVGTSCDLQPSTNWGDPVGLGAPCSAYLPVIRVDGDVTINGGVGQGILLVSGDLRITAPFTFHGMMIVKGAADVTAPTDIRGILAAAELRSGTGPVSQLKVQYSKCIISNDLEFSASLSPLSSRAWIQLFQAP